MFGAGYRTPAKGPEMTKSSEDTGINLTTPERLSPAPSAVPRAPSKPKAKALSQDSAKAVRRTTTEVKEGPMEEPKYVSRTAEAKACLVKAKLHLGNSRNLKTDIKAEVTQAIERLYALVKEAEAEAKEGRGQSFTVSLPRKESEREPKEMEKDLQTCTLKNILEDHTVLIRESMRKTEELKMVIEEQSEKLARVTYASVASAGPATRATKERTALHSVIISSKNDQDTGEEVLEKVREAIDAKQGWIKVEKVRKAKDRKVVVGCATQEERRKIKERLEKKGEYLVVEEVKNRDPLLVLKDVISKHSDEDIIKALRNQNREIFRNLENEEERLVVKYRKRTRNPHTNHIVLTASPTIWRRAVDAEKLRVDLQRVKVEDHSPLAQCSLCLGYGHSKRLCKETIAKCSHCGGPHLRADCADWIANVPPMCCNCTRARLDSGAAEHNAFSQDCPVRRKWDALARSSIAYC